MSLRVLNFYQTALVIENINWIKRTQQAETEKAQNNATIAEIPTERVWIS